ncbi:MAG: hypothetical protein VXU42_03455, partial [Verrucomicrobiota bacterium]|nr:hypothetical protein [Verrucomicrobiota bacterium]
KSLKPISDPEEVVVHRLNSFVNRLQLWGISKAQVDEGEKDQPSHLKSLVVWIKCHKSGYRPLALNAANPLADLCKMISDALIAVEFETHKMYRDLIATHLGYVVDRNWTNSSSDETAERWAFLNKVVSPELMSKCHVLSADIEAAYPSFPFQLIIETMIVTLKSRGGGEV